MVGWREQKNLEINQVSSINCVLAIQSVVKSWLNEDKQVRNMKTENERDFSQD
jgi:hypothetical protein